MKIHRTNAPGDEGFTLVEMLVVVLILGALSSMAVIGVQGARRTTVVQACTTDWQSLESALQSYGNDHFHSATGAPDYSGLGADPIAVLSSGTARYLSGGGSSYPTAYLETVTIAPSGSTYTVSISRGDGTHANTLAEGASTTQAASACSAAVA